MWYIIGIIVIVVILLVLLTRKKKPMVSGPGKTELPKEEEKPEDKTM